MSVPRGTSTGSQLTLSGGCYEQPTAVDFATGNAGALAANFSSASGNKETRQHRNQLFIREGLLEQHTAGHAVSLSMKRAVACHVDHGHRWLQITSASRHVPSVTLSGHPDVSEHGTDGWETVLQSSDCVVRIGNKNGGEASIRQNLAEEEADDELVFGDKDDWFPRLIQAYNPSLLATAKLTGCLQRLFNRIAHSAANILWKQVAVIKTNALLGEVTTIARPFRSDLAHAPRTQEERDRVYPEIKEDVIGMVERAIVEVELGIAWQAQRVERCNTRKAKLVASDCLRELEESLDTLLETRRKFYARRVRYEA
jgi:hypothetical protein